MRIVNIMQGTHLGGTEHASLRLMQGLLAAGHACEVVSLTPLGTLAPLLREHGIPASGLSYSGKGGWRSFFLLRRTLRSVKADALLMTGHNLLAMLALGDLCRGKRILAVHFHHTGVKPSWQWRLIYRIACRYFQAVTFPCDFIRLEAEMLFPALKSLAHTVRNPLEFPALPSVSERESARAALDLDSSAPIIGNAGWLIPRKRFDVFLRVAQKVSQALPNAQFLIAGDGDELQRLQMLAKELNIADRVKWLGWQENLAHFYQALNVMLFNSDFDAMGLSPLEAVSYGVPLVASVKHGGLKEIVSDDEYGSLISAHDIDALAAKVVYFIRNEAQARKTALACREKIMQLSNAENIIQEVEMLFREPSHV